MEKVLTYEEIEQKRRRKEKLTTSETLILMVNQLAKHKPKGTQRKFKRELLELMIQNPNYTEEERNALRVELSRMSVKQTSFLD